MSLNTVLINDNEYYIIKKIKLNNNIYFLLINCNNEKDFCIRKKFTEKNEEYLIGLDNQAEFNNVMMEFHKLEKI